MLHLASPHQQRVGACSWHPQACGPPLGSTYSERASICRASRPLEHAYGTGAVVPDAVPAVTCASPCRLQEMRKGGRIPQRDKLRVVERGLKGFDRVPLCHINKAEPSVRHKAPVEPSRDVAWLSFHKGFRRF